MDLIKNIDAVLKLWKFNGNDAIKITKRCKTKSINVNDVVYDWFCAARDKNILVNAIIFKEKALQVSKELEVENFKESNSSLKTFKLHHNISFKVICGESKSVDTEIVDE